ncbi:MAG TPA: hypothetical protein VMF32_17410 [Xanthobacteraceae bacterium]|nr:hypothetical protein [Xanthobacteraceae bacterium]
MIDDVAAETIRQWVNLDKNGRHTLLVGVRECTGKIRIRYDRLAKKLLASVCLAASII